VVRALDSPVQLALAGNFSAAVVAPAGVVASNPGAA
jgi:hypothetical protein